MPRKSKDNLFTERGEATRTRIIEAAAAIIYANSAGRMSLDEVMEASRTSKSQLYHYFADKDALVREVIRFQTRRILEANAKHLDHLASFEALYAWRDMMVLANRAAGGIGGCPLGSLANELSNQSEGARFLLADGLDAWRVLIEMGLARMKHAGEIVSTADTQALAIAFLSAIQGGILMAKTTRDPRLLEIALDMAITHLERSRRPELIP